MNQRFLWSILGSILSVSSHAQNEASSSSSGNLNQVTITQVAIPLGDYLKSNVTQEGDGNIALIEQIKSSGSQIKIKQLGDQGNVTVKQNGDDFFAARDNVATVLQSGFNNTVDIDQSFAERSTSALINQSGENNTIDINQKESYRNAANVTQGGIDGLIQINQSGLGSTLNRVQVTQNSDASTIKVDQGSELRDSESNLATVDQQSGDHHDASITQGFFNVATIIQSGAYNIANITQDDYNRAMATETGIGSAGRENRIDITQELQGNYANASLSGHDNNTIKINQQGGDGFNMDVTESNALNMIEVARSGADIEVVVNQVYRDF